MDNRPAESVSHDLDALFRLGVVGGVSDEQLLERFAAQTESDSEIAFDAIVRRHGPMVMGVCRRSLGNHHDAEDAFQATFIVLAMRAGAVRKRQSLGPWLHGVAARICQRARLVNRRRQETPIPAGDLIEDRGQGPALADLNRVLDEELRQLPDKYRLPVVLCYLEGRAQEEAARELGWTKGTVSGRLARAKEVLQRRLIRRGLAPAVALSAASLLSESASASASVGAPLLASTVRTATLASFSGLKAGSTTAEVGNLVRLAVRALALGRIAKMTAVVFLFGIGASAIATQALSPPWQAWQNIANTKAKVTGGRNAIQRGPRLDRFGDVLPPDIKTRLGTTQRRHTARVVGVAFSDEDNTAVTAQADGLVRFWDVEIGRQLRSIDVTAATIAGTKSVRQIAVSRDGKHIAAAGFVREAGTGRPVDTVWIVNLRDGRPLRTIDSKTTGLQCLAYSPDGTTIATGASAGEVKLWDIATGDCRKTITLAQNQLVFAVSFSADEKILAANQGDGVTLCDLQSGDKKLLTIPSIAGFTPHFSDDGRYLAIGKLGAESVIWDRQSSLQQHTVRGFALGFSPDGRSLLVARSDEGAISLINAETGDEQWKTVLGSAMQYGGLTFTSDGKTIIVSWDNVVRFIEADTGREKVESNDAHRGAVSAGWRESSIRLYSTEDGHEIDTFACPATRTHPSAIAFAPDSGGLAVGLDDTTAVIFNVRNGR
jgi:RNA polymerase sigma factor (sigma-70 family)